MCVQNEACLGTESMSGRRERTSLGWSFAVCGVHFVTWDSGREHKDADFEAFLRYSLPIAKSETEITDPSQTRRRFVVNHG